jgi:hypothetical protein
LFSVKHYDIDIDCGFAKERRITVIGEQYFSYIPDDNKLANNITDAPNINVTTNYSVAISATM